MLQNLQGYYFGIVTDFLIGMFNADTKAKLSCNTHVDDNYNVDLMIISFSVDQLGIVMPADHTPAFSHLASTAYSL